MHIAGGLYRERCYMPEWDALFGSGGRAALAIANLSSGCTLHSYVDNHNIEDTCLIEKMGITMRLTQRPTSIEFTYFHPLSKPFLQPEVNNIQREVSIHVSGDAVLRFGYIEGDAIVDGNRVVYDPQTWKNPEPFHFNGSKANELAIVLNEEEVKSLSGINDLNLAALNLIDSENVDVVIVKRGSRGAKVFEKGCQTDSIPAYRSSKVFKIGTGDVFSAIFAYYWAEKRLSSGKAADIASRSVAVYCNTGELPLVGKKLNLLKPIKYVDSGSVLLLGATDTIGQRYTIEEARFVLKELGMKVSCPILDGKKGVKTKVALLIADGLGPRVVKQLKKETIGMPLIVLKESEDQVMDELVNDRDCVIIDDFTSAMYFSAWAAEEFNE